MRQPQERSLEAVGSEPASSVIGREAVEEMVAKTASMLAMTNVGPGPKEEPEDPGTDEIGPIVIDAVFEVGSDPGETDTVPFSAWRPIPREQ